MQTPLPTPYASFASLPSTSLPLQCLGRLRLDLTSSPSLPLLIETLTKSTKSEDKKIKKEGTKKSLGMAKKVISSFGVDISSVSFPQNEYVKIKATIYSDDHIYIRSAERPTESPAVSVARTRHALVSRMKEEIRPVVFSRNETASNTFPSLK